MIVKIVATSNFLGVPEEMLPDTRKLDQDRGNNLERLIECAGRVCYDSYGKGRSSEEYHQHILQSGHGSVLEHASISFFISGISRGCSHELVRHRVGIAISQRSTRYVDESESEWITHPVLKDLIAIGMKQKDCGTGLNYDETVEVDDDIYSIETSAKRLYNYVVKYLQDRGVSRKQARGAARGFLGNALSTELIVTFNIRALRHFIEMRATEGADAEIRLLANRIYEEALTYCPAYFSDYTKHECSDGIGFELRTEYKKL